MPAPDNTPHRPWGDDRRASGTRPLDAFAAGTPTPDAVVRREDLAREIVQGEKLITGFAVRVAALERALAASAPLNRSLDELFAGVAANERAFTMQLTRVLAERSETRRQAQIVLQQYQMASQALKEAQEVHGQFVASQLEVGRVEGFSLSRFKGSLYPLYNFAKVFEGVPMLGQLFPVIRPSTPTMPLSAAPERDTRPLKPEVDALGRLSRLVKETPQLAPIEGLLDRGLDMLRLAREAAPGLKARGSGILKRMHEAAPGLLGRHQDPTPEVEAAPVTESQGIPAE